MASTDEIILRELLAAGETPVSGPRLAKLLGVSRVAVWMHLRKLAGQGFVFSAVSDVRGRRVLGRDRPHDPWHFA